MKTHQKKNLFRNSSQNQNINYFFPNENATSVKVSSKSREMKVSQFEQIIQQKTQPLTLKNFKLNQINTVKSTDQKLKEGKIYDNIHIFNKQLKSQYDSKYKFNTHFQEKNQYSQSNFYIDTVENNSNQTGQIKIKDIIDSKQQNNQQKKFIDIDTQGSVKVRRPLTDNIRQIKKDLQYKRDIKQQTNFQVQIIQIINQIKHAFEEKKKQNKSIIVQHEDIVVIQKGLDILHTGEQLDEFYKLIARVLNETTYVNKDIFVKYEELIQNIFDQSIYRQLFDQTKLQTLTNSQMIKKLLKVFNKHYFIKEKEIKMLQHENTTITETNQKIKKQIDQLNGVIKNDKGKNVVNFVQQELDQLKKEHEQLQQQYKEKITELDEKDNVINEYQALLGQLNEENTEMQKNIQQNKQLEESFMVEKQEQIVQIKHKIENIDNHKEKILTMRYYIESLLIKTNTINEHFKALEKEKNQIQNERLDLIKRAAAGFENLTPRPDIKQICEENDLQYNVIFKEDKKAKQKPKQKINVVRFDNKKKTTEDYFVQLIQQLSQCKKTQRTGKEKNMDEQQTTMGPRVSMLQPLSDNLKKNQKLNSIFEQEQKMLQSEINSQQFYKKQKEFVQDIKNSIKDLDELVDLDLN